MARPYPLPPSILQSSMVITLRKEEKKKNKGCGKKKGERKQKKKKREKGGKRKYNCLKRREGIVIVNFQRILFTMLTFLLK
jgi:hypothetical protein